MKIDLFLPPYVPGYSHSWNLTEGWVGTLQRKGMLGRVFRCHPKKTRKVFSYLPEADSDLMLFMGGDHHLYFLHDTPKKRALWQRTRIPRVAFCYESVLDSNFPDSRKKSDSATQTFTHLIHCDEKDADFYKGKIPAIWLPQCVDETLFKPAPANAPRIPKVFFRGKTNAHLHYDSRRALLEKLKPDPAFHFAETLMTDEQYAKACSDYALALNLPNNFGGYNVRAFETLASGCLLFQNRIPNRPRNEALFSPDECILYDPAQPDALIEKVHDAIARPEKYEHIARNGRAACLKSHTITHRIEQILEFVFGTPANADTTTEPYHAKSPVLFIIFNRPETTKLVFEKIRAARPTRLYIAADGPRPNRDGEAALCAQTRDAVISHIDWPCEIKTLLRDQNLGCKNAVSSALDWFFAAEPEGIILEDDCVPSPDFFRFCDTLLEKYRDDPRIRHIAGVNLQRGIRRGDASYYFSRITHIWGWASWRRVWKDYDKTLTTLDETKVAAALREAYAEPIIVEEWLAVINRLKAGKIDTWDYQLGIANLMSGGLCIIPNTNLVTNIGFGPGATHTHDSANKNAGIPARRLGPLTHPPADAFKATQEADIFSLANDCDLERKKKKRRSPRYRLKRALKKLLRLD